MKIFIFVCIVHFLYNTASLPPIPAGEDNISFQRHCRVLEAEWRKTKRSPMVVEELMKRTYAFRRRDIVETGRGVEEIFELYPFLQDSDQVCCH